MQATPPPAEATSPRRGGRTACHRHARRETRPEPEGVRTRLRARPSGLRRAAMSRHPGDGPHACTARPPALASAPAPTQPQRSNDGEPTTRRPARVKRHRAALLTDGRPPAARKPTADGTSAAWLLQVQEATGSSRTIKARHGARLGVSNHCALQSLARRAQPQPRHPAPKAHQRSRARSSNATHTGSPRPWAPVTAEPSSSRGRTATPWSAPTIGPTPRAICGTPPSNWQSATNSSDRAW